MKVLYQGAELPITSLKLVESFRQFYSYVEVGSYTSLIGEFEVVYDENNENSKVKFWGISTKVVSGITTTKGIALDLWKLLNQTTKPLNKECTFADVCKDNGIKLRYSVAPESQWWCLRAHKLLNFIEDVRFKVKAGTAPLMTFDQSGILTLLDLKTALASSPVEVIPDNATLNYSTAWAFDVPALCTITNLMVTEDQEDQESKVVDNYGAATQLNFITQEELSYLPQQIHQNLANIKLYSTSVLTFRTKFNVPFCLGACYKVKDFQGVVVSVDTDFNDTVLTLVNANIAD